MKNTGIIRARVVVKAILWWPISCSYLSNRNHFYSNGWLLCHVYLAYNTYIVYVGRNVAIICFSYFMDQFELAATWIINYAIVYTRMLSECVWRVVTSQTTYEWPHFTGHQSLWYPGSIDTLQEVGDSFRGRLTNIPFI